MGFKKGYTPWNKGIKNWRKPLVFSLESRKKMSESAKKRAPSFKGKHHSESSKEKIRIARAKQIPPWLGKKRPGLAQKLPQCQKGFRGSPATEFKKGIQNNPNGGFPGGHTPWNKDKPFLQMRGEKNNRWKGGITELNNKIRTSLEYKIWRRAVFIRDNFTCQSCKKRGCYLIADHIKPFCIYIKLRFEVSNGRTLCKECDKKLGWKPYKKIK